MNFPRLSPISYGISIPESLLSFQPAVSFLHSVLCVGVSLDQSAPIMEIILFPTRREKKIHPLNQSKLQREHGDSGEAPY